jgi:NAD(P)-dependent dehydrogenase (short-subunit alcohol dehydrogenase family)
MSRAMAKDYARHNIRVIPICPGDVDTRMLRGEFKDRGLTAAQGLQESAAGVPLNRVASAEEIAQWVLFCASDAAAFLTGQPVIVDGGNRA